MPVLTQNSSLVDVRASLHSTPLHHFDTKPMLQTRDPRKRLGTRSAQEVKRHPFFKDIQWDKVTAEKPVFIPQLEDPFDTRWGVISTQLLVFTDVVEAFSRFISLILCAVVRTRTFLLGFF